MKNYKRCSGARDMQDLIINTELEILRKQVKQGEVTKEEYQKQWVNAEKKAKELWQQLQKKNNKFYARDGYIDVEYLSDKKEYRRKPLVKGRPIITTEVKKDTRVTVRLNKKEIEILENYCKDNNNITKSKAIQQLINNLSSKYY